MIKDIQLKNFIAHKDTKIEFCKGITIFLGHNGSGKSSIIDGGGQAPAGADGPSCSVDGCGTV